MGPCCSFQFNISTWNLLSLQQLQMSRSTLPQTLSNINSTFICIHILYYSYCLTVRILWHWCTPTMYRHDGLRGSTVTCGCPVMSWFPDDKMKSVRIIMHNHTWLYVEKDNTSVFDSTSNGGVSGVASVITSVEQLKKKPRLLFSREGYAFISLI